jgi:hypothetical protein
MTRASYIHAGAVAGLNIWYIPPEVTHPQPVLLDAEVPITEMLPGLVLSRNVVDPAQLPVPPATAAPLEMPAVVRKSSK